MAIGILDYDKNQGAVYFQAPNQEIKESQEENFKLKQMTEKEMLEQFWQIADKYGEFITFNGRGI